MANIKNVIEILPESDKSLSEALVEFYETMRNLEQDAERAGKQATKIIMTINDLKSIYAKINQTDKERTGHWQ